MDVELVRLAEQYLGRLPVLKVAGPYLVDLRDSTGGTVLVATLVAGDVVYVDRVDGVDAGGVLRDATRLVPALHTASGRVLLAEADDFPRLAGIVRELTADGLSINVTAVMTMEQVMGVAECVHPDAATFVSIFAGRIMMYRTHYKWVPRGTRSLTALTIPTLEDLVA